MKKPVGLVVYAITRLKRMKVKKQIVSVAHISSPSFTLWRIRKSFIGVVSVAIERNS